MREFNKSFAFRISHAIRSDTGNVGVIVNVSNERSTLTELVATHESRAIFLILRRFRKRHLSTTITDNINQERSPRGVSASVLQRSPRQFLEHLPFSRYVIAGSERGWKQGSRRGNICKCMAAGVWRVSTLVYSTPAFLQLRIAGTATRPRRRGHTRLTRLQP